MINQIKVSQESFLEIIFRNKQIDFFERKRLFDTKNKIHCLGCKKIIFIDYNESNGAKIFCEGCLDERYYANVVQVQYFRVIKEKQMTMLDKLIGRGKEKISENLH